MPRKSVLDHLARLYGRSDDPWNHRTSPYEARKYAATLDTIGPGPFGNALEIGCGNGTLSRRLAPRCRRLTAMDVTPAAVEAARRHLADLPHVAVVHGMAPRDLPDGSFDLILLSEVLYFLTPDDISLLGHWLRGHAAGRIVAVNWTGPTDEELDGPRAVALLAGAIGQPATTDHADYRIDVF
ncbi:methyltransferase domain-containing protein [Paracoccus subflavus]|uniref:Methyltransferase domain-containing protein n=1 Tax=Paracoccus subflavus TaxID=2528244 RepID=A0A4Q9FXX8_9RHOB|nr:SAM-dependent methyltransferase [Paracoccus subflavus]TBN39035.1 methyltransferase domain-containing protein [Paracoccus subflavus]